ncbi:MAG TPA: protein DpdF [Trichocoleus sp.]|jgi:superfamily II DNA/RNA helicase
MQDVFQQIRDYISGEAVGLPHPENCSESCQRRLVRALRETGAYKPGSKDIVALIRHFLRHGATQQGSPSITQKVSRKIISYFGKPNNQNYWESSSLKVLREEAEYFLVDANPWQPNWLNESAWETLDIAAFQEIERRTTESVSGDPFLSQMGLKTYQSSGQRQAIRSILTAPSTSTLVINLPTGSGKSLCAHLPAWLQSGSVGVTIVVVPTTALAIDQERAFQSRTKTSDAVAYYQDDSLPGQERREEIRNRIRNGTQRIVFTSPEGLLDSLAGSVYEAAERGFLRYFIIDEAHMVEQWGDEFRPSFQELPGFRRSLLRLTSFPTILLTATLTSSCLDTLETLFAEPGPFQTLSAVQLRPEPSYWFAWCRSQEERQQRLLESLDNLPRPIIIYGSKKQDVEDWFKTLQNSGFKRSSMMTGDSSLAERLKLLEDWQNCRVDIVVATSAFGLGVDLPDVRVVIHGCVPETIDRFYQEVGRGGRDGKATISLTLHTTADLDIAAKLNEKSFITIDLGRQRWTAMFNKKTAYSNGCYCVPVDTAPSYSPDLIGDRNRAWNIRTLTLMSRSGLISLDSQPPPKQINFDSEVEYQRALQTNRNLRILQIQNEYHLESETWQTIVEPIRQQQQQWTYKSLKLMREALRGKRCLSEIFAEAYRIPTREDPRRSQVFVSLSCGSCSFCRQQNRQPFFGISPNPLPVWKQPAFYVGETLQEKLAGFQQLFIFYSPPANKLTELRRGKFFKWLIDQGIRNLVAPLSLYESLAKTAGKTPIFLFEEYDSLRMPKIPTLVIHPEKISLPSKYLLPLSSEAPIVLFLPIDTPDPKVPHRRLIEVCSGRHFTFDSFCMEISL